MTDPQDPPEPPKPFTMHDMAWANRPESTTPAPAKVVAAPRMPLEYAVRAIPAVVGLAAILPWYSVSVPFFGTVSRSGWGSEDVWIPLLAALLGSYLAWSGRLLAAAALYGVATAAIVVEIAYRYDHAHNVINGYVASHGGLASVLASEVHFSVGAGAWIAGFVCAATTVGLIVMAQQAANACRN